MMNKNQLVFVLRNIFLILFLLAWGFTAWAQRPEIEKAMMEGDHKALATYYRVESASLKEAAAEHERMGKLYQKNHEHYKDFGQIMAHHCENLRLQALQASYQYEALAKQEEEMAQQDKKKKGFKE